MKKLKIKDNVDLKVLEEHRYIDCGNYYSKEVMEDRNSKVWTWHEKIIIRKDDRVIRTKITRDTVEEEWFGYVISKDHFVYDLSDYIEEVYCGEKILDLLEE